LLLAVQVAQSDPTRSHHASPLLECRFQARRREYLALALTVTLFRRPLQAEEASLEASRAVLALDRRRAVCHHFVPKMNCQA
jgi:hypothetical protein